MAKDYYGILGVAKGASEDEIKKAFRTIAHKHHPDKGGDEKKFKEASEAYTVLSDKKKRAQYDTFGQYHAGGAQGRQGGFSGPEGFDFSQFSQQFGGQGGFSFNGQEFDMGDIFGEFFGRNGGAAGHAQARGRDVSIDIELSFKESVFGVERRVLVSKLGACDTCGGSGAKEGSKMVSCKTCNGRGEIRETRSTFFGSFTTARACPTCHGRTQIPETPCAKCRGAGIAQRQEEIRIAVPAGVSDGEMVRMPGHGEAIQGGTAGDLYIKLHVRDDTRFAREGHNLVTVLPIKLTEALLGAARAVPTLEGEASVIVPAGVAHGAIIRVRGMGVPYGRGNRGDLLVRIEIELPKKLSKTAHELVEKLKQEGL